jgi:hypothetical protein
MALNLILYLVGFEIFVNTHIGNIVPIMIVFIIYAIGYRGLWQPEIFTSENKGIEIATKY